MSTPRLTLFLCLVVLGCDPADPPADAAVDAGALDAGPGCPAPSPPASDRSGRTVTFRLTAAEGTYVAVAGQLCSPFQIDDFIHAAPFNCPCECAAPSTTTTARAVGDGLELAWNGDRLQMYRECHDCAESGWPGQGLQEVTLTIPRAVEPGPHMLRLLVGEPFEGACTEGTDCLVNPGYQGSISAPDGSLCEADGFRRVELPFELPPTGDVQIDLVIPDA